MIRKVILIVAGLSMLLPLFAGCAPPQAAAITEINTTATATQTKKAAPTIALAPDVITQAVNECSDKKNWGINLARIAIQYLPGATIEGAIVLHNGQDAERLVKLYYKTPKGPSRDSKSGEMYDPAPIEASGWVSIGGDTLRLKKMQTEVIDVSLTVPAGTKLSSKLWEFQVRAAGYEINRYEQELIVKTVENDTSLLVDLHHPLLEADLGAVLEVKSTLPEDNPALADYNADTFELLIDGLAPEAERTITITYEYPGMVAVDYGQRWLIKNLD